MISLLKRTSIKEGLDKVGLEDCDGNQDNAINSEDIQTSVVADGREVYNKLIYAMVEREEGEPVISRSYIYSLLLIFVGGKSKEYQLRILFEKRKKLHVCCG